MKKWKMASGFLMVMGLMACKGNHSGAQIIQKMQVQDGKITDDQGKYIQYASDPHKGRSLLRVVNIEAMAAL